METGFKSEYFDKLAALEENNFWFRVRNKIIIWAIRKYAIAHTNFLEVGCGTGFVTQAVAREFPGTRITGSEFFEEGLLYARGRVPNAEFIKLDARAMPYESEFSIIGAFDVLEHIKEDELVMENLHQALDENGVLFVTVPQHRWLWSHVDERACHERRYSSGEIHSKLEKAGFEIVRSTSFVSLLLPLMILSRIMKKDTPGDGYDETSELQINPVLNKVLEVVMKLDFLLIRMGVNFPLGGSRLVVARKT